MLTACILRCFFFNTYYVNVKKQKNNENLLAVIIKINAKMIFKQNKFIE
jgi:hypothetical protein